MIKKALIFTLALFFAVGSHLRPVCDYEIRGEQLRVGCSVRAAERAERTAALAAEEILRGPAQMPAARRKLRLTFRKPDRDARTLADALLRAADGVAVCDRVTVGDRRLGFVSDGAALRRALYVYISNTLPTWAEGGILSRELRLERRYTRAGLETPTEDMLLLVTGAAPVMYFDGAGSFGRA